MLVRFFRPREDTRAIAAHNERPSRCCYRKIAKVEDSSAIVREKSGSFFVNGLASGEDVGVKCAISAVVVTI